MAENTEDSSSSSSSSSSNSTRSDDESQGLIARDFESVDDSNSISYDNGIEGPEVNSQSKTLNTDETLYAGLDTDAEVSSEFGGFEQVMSDYPSLRMLCKVF